MGLFVNGAGEKPILNENEDRACFTKPGKGAGSKAKEKTTMEPTKEKIWPEKRIQRDFERVEGWNFAKVGRGSIQKGDVCGPLALSNLCRVAAMGDNDSKEFTPVGKEKAAPEKENEEEAEHPWNRKKTVNLVETERYVACSSDSMGKELVPYSSSSPLLGMNVGVPELGESSALVTSWGGEGDGNEETPLAVIPVEGTSGLGREDARDQPRIEEEEDGLSRVGG